MLVTITLILISWLIGWRFDKQSLSALGLFPRAVHCRIFIIGLLTAVIAGLVYFGLTILFSKSNVAINPKFTLLQFLKSFGWVFNSVAMEEFIFRGIVFYFVLKKWGVKMACVLSAVVFGMFHWQLNGIWGNLVPMVYIFLLTASAGWSFAYAFTKANSILFPIGLHLGWNIINIIVFSEGPLGKQWLITNNGIEVDWVISLLLFIYQLTIFPLLVIVLSKSKRLIA